MSKKIDRQAERTGNKAAAYFNNVASVVTRLLDRLLGRRLFSVQMVGVSSALSLAGLFIVGGLTVGFLLHLLRRLPSIPKNLPPNLSADLSIFTVLCLVLGCVFLFFALLPSFWPGRTTRVLSLAPVLLIVAGALRMWMRGALVANQSLELATLAAGVLCDAGLLVIVRKSNRWIAETASWRRMAAVITGQVAFAGAVVWLPLDAGADLSVAFHWKIFPTFLMWTAIFNLFTGLAALMVGLALIGLLVHRAFWPVVAHFFYQLARHKVIRNHKAMGRLCAICVPIAFPSLSGLAGGTFVWTLTEFLSGAGEAPTSTGEPGPRAGTQAAGK
ncbi:MAG TPA: hypothetical protein VNK23_04105 [Candidatus Dormibacteraeota bacterium]|nr:hypothetical protein [Candidatus Dormibacteraeota bacterium]